MTQPTGDQSKHQVQRSMWGPSTWGRLFGGAEEWSLQIDPEQLTATLHQPREPALPGAQRLPVDAVTVRPGWLWSTVVVAQSGGRSVTLAGLSNGRRRSLQDVLERCRHLLDLRGAFDQGLAQVVPWANALQQQMQGWDRWWPRELVESWQQGRPVPGPRFEEARTATELRLYLEGQPGSVHEALKWWDAPLDRFAKARNERFLVDEALRRQGFFATVESSPMTEEQTRAVVCFDNRVQVVAAAGSGKTSTMVARAAYAIHHGLVPPERILMLAFNKKAAEELQERVRRRVGNSGAQVTASTFHAFGLRVLGEASNRKPRVAKGLGAAGEGEGVTRLEQVVDALRDRSLRFRVQWDLFRLVFGRPLADFDEVEDPEAWDPDSGQSGFRTLNGEVVKSREELMLANWLFYNGVTYRYERNYEHDTADASHSQYQPDFYYPDIDVYHEHFALNHLGQAPPHFTGYLDGIAWKRATHTQHGTTLLETTSATVRDGSAFDYLTRELTARGVTLDPNPDREVAGEPPVRFEQLITLFRTFLTHVKSNRLTDQELRDRADTALGDQVRAHHFLNLFTPVLREWDQTLRDANEVDFEDMINRAADLIEAGKWTSPYELVMVDEMQDSSYARSRLVRALVNTPGRYLFAVGDDWQSINRFAGSDLTVMTRFNEWFGAGETLQLERTFRSPQTICDISSQFVTKNPDQLTKHVRSEQPEYSPALRAIAVQASRYGESDQQQYDRAVITYLQHLNTTVPAPPGRRLHVMILGRYRAGRTKVQAALTPGRWKHLQVDYSTIHSAKGKEADYVIIIDLTAGALPSTIEDDPLLTLAMPAPERYPHAEERRLFYVALTRTRRSVLLLTVAGRESPFLLELIKDRKVTLTTPNGAPVSVTPCPKCQQGRLVDRTNRETGRVFAGCNRFPRCRYTVNNRR